MKKSLFLLLATILVLPSRLWAESPEQDKALLLNPASVRIEQVPLESLGTEYLNRVRDAQSRQSYGGYQLPNPANAAASAAVPELAVLEQIVNLTDKIWTLIAKNKPVVDVANKYGTAVPRGIKTWTVLEYWSEPKTYAYRFYAENLYGVKVYDVTYMVTYCYGGSYKGRGKYLTAVTVEPLSVNIAWGYNFNLGVDIPDSGVVNVGTRQDPVAGMQVILKYTVSTIVQYYQGRSVYFIKGDGRFNSMSNRMTRMPSSRGVELDAEFAAE